MIGFHAPPNRESSSAMQGTSVRITLGTLHSSFLSLQILFPGTLPEYWNIVSRQPVCLGTPSSAGREKEDSQVTLCHGRVDDNGDIWIGSPTTPLKGVVVSEYSVNLWYSYHQLFVRPDDSNDTTVPHGTVSKRRTG